MRSRRQYTERTLGDSCRTVNNRIALFETMAKVPKIHARMACFIAADLRRRRLSVDGLLKEVGLQRRIFPVLKIVCRKPQFYT